jgi:hypothetical protein
MKESIKEKVKSSIEWFKMYYPDYFYTDTSFEKEKNDYIKSHPEFFIDTREQCYENT